MNRVIYRFCEFADSFDDSQNQLSAELGELLSHSGDVRADRVEKSPGLNV